MRWTLAFCVFTVVGLFGKCLAAERSHLGPDVGEQQLPLRMHSQMRILPTVTVGTKEADIIGSDNRALQAAVDYVAGLGGGTVVIGPGEYVMYDSLHLRNDVTVRGAGEKTVLRKAPGVVSPLAVDGDFGEQQITVTDPTGFQVGYGVAIWDDHAGGFHTTVARIIGQNGNTFAVDKPLMADCMVANKAIAATVFPVISGYDLTGAVVEDLTIEGSKEDNILLNGCRGAGIFLYRAHGTILRNCIVRNYNGDGISFQQSNDVTVSGCQSLSNAALGLHPGSGSQRPKIHGCVAKGNGTDGLFLCWRVRHGIFENNILEGNGRFGISIGHKDTDNLLRTNQVRRNASNGIFFRNETVGMAAHRNRLVDNVIEDNGTDPGTAAIRIRGETHDLVFQGNIIRDTRPTKTQSIDVQIEERVGDVSLLENNIDADVQVQDRRPLASNDR